MKKDVSSYDLGIEALMERIENKEKTIYAILIIFALLYLSTAILGLVCAKHSEYVGVTIFAGTATILILICLLGLDFENKFRKYILHKKKKGKP